MTYIERQADLISKINGISTHDNTIDPITSFPAIVVDVEAEEYENYTTGAEPHKYQYHLYIMDSLENNGNSLSATRATVAKYMKDTIESLGVNVAQNITYSALIVNEKECCGVETIIETWSEI